MPRGGSRSGTNSSGTYFFFMVGRISGECSHCDWELERQSKTFQPTGDQNPITHVLHHHIGNRYTTPGGSNSGSGSSYHYSNSNGSYYYANDNGSTYYDNGSSSRYTSSSGTTRYGSSSQKK